MLTAENEKTLVELGFTRKYFNKSLQKRYKGINGNLSIVIAPNGSWTISGYGPYPEDMRADLAILREKGIV